MSAKIHFVIAPTRVLSEAPDGTVNLGTHGQMAEWTFGSDNHRFYIQANSGELRNLVHTSRNTSNIDGYQWHNGGIHNAGFHGSVYFDSDSYVNVQSQQWDGQIVFNPSGDSGITNGRFYGDATHYESASIYGNFISFQGGVIGAGDGGRIELGYNAELYTSPGSYVGFNGTVSFFGASGRDNPATVYYVQSNPSTQELADRLNGLQYILQQYGMVSVS